MRTQFTGGLLAMLIHGVGCGGVSVKGPGIQADAAHKGPADPSEAVCVDNEALYKKAKKLYKRKQFDAALELAAQVQRDPQCEFVFVQALGLISRIQVFELKAKQSEGIRESFTIPPPASVSQDTSIQTRYLIADAADRRAVKALGAARNAKSRELLREAISMWQEFQDFCMDGECPQHMHLRAEERLAELRRMLLLQDGPDEDR